MVDSCSGLTFTDLLFSISDAQLVSLLQKNLHPNHWVFKVMPQLRQIHGDLKKLTRRVVDDKTAKGRTEIDFVNEVKKALGKWIPDRKKLRGMISYQAKLHQKNPREDENDEDNFDEEDIRQMQESRTGMVSML